MISECVCACLCYLIDMNRNQMFKEKRRKMCLASGKEVLGRNCVSGVYWTQRWSQYFSAELDNAYYDFCLLKYNNSRGVSGA